MYSTKGFPGIGVPKTEGLSKYLLMRAKALLQALSHSKCTSFFINILKGWHWLAKFEINRCMWASFPYKPLSSRRFLGSSIFWIASILDWSISIPRCLTMKPRNFLDVTPKAHLRGFILSWYFLRQLNTDRKSARWSSLLFVLTTRSLT